MGEFPSGQRGQTVNLLSVTSVVRIHLLPPEKDDCESNRLFQLYSSYGELYRSVDGGMSLKFPQRWVQMTEIIIKIEIGSVLGQMFRLVSDYLLFFYLF